MGFEPSPQFILTAVFGLYVIFMIFAIFTIKKRKSERIRDRDDIRQEKRFKAKFFKNITEGFQLESIKNLDDIINIYEAVAGLSDEDLNYHYGLSRYLREYLIALISKDDKIIPDSTTEEEIREWKQTLDKIISLNDIQTPFSDLPPLERNILNDITIFLKRDDKEHINDKLKELSRLIKARDSELNKIYKKNDGSMQIAVISLLASLIFGLVAIKQYI
ncbi:hypothetical protein L1994_08460 [Methanomicrobium antiquum]|uniref:Uncharacterized protein n=1 Tax=Methanomicrobium antiquum TaxID=487686 RepID=A0AAF0JM85_9EURY|nr:hypothetical protein [Methanomicrobium antiquum]MDD3977635.1 hypothetical protein [Methanomicrobium sp.]WFN36176.1 hypothetical protein L1994_08460 [Methanomicrobium antiquum]